MTTPNPPLATITEALADAAEYRRANADAADLARVRAYRAVAADLAAGRMVVISSTAASHVSPDGTLALALSDLTVMLGALHDGAAWRNHVRDSRLAGAYAAMARALGDDR